MTGEGQWPADRVVSACDERRDVVVDVIRRARSRLSLSLFRCTDKAVFSALGEAVHRGVDVEVLVTSRAKGGKEKRRLLWERLEATGASIHAYDDPVVKYHAKYLVADDGPALIASLSLTRKCFTETFDVIVSTYDPDVVRGLRSLMDADRRGQPAPADLPARLIVGPEGARRRLTALIANATTSVKLIDAKLSDPALIALLQQRRADGLRVEIVDARRLGPLKSHAKMLLVDGRYAVVGSLALTALSLDFRREVAVALDDPRAVAAIAQLFDTVRAAAGSASSVAAGKGMSC